MAALLSFLSLKLNSLLKFSLQTSLWTIWHIPPTHLPSDYNLPVIRILNNNVFYDPSGLNPQKVYGPNGVLLTVLKNCASVLTFCLVKLFCLCLSTFTFPSYWKYNYIQPVPRRGDHSNPSNYWPIALLSCLFKALETILRGGGG